MADRHADKPLRYRLCRLRSGGVFPARLCGMTTDRARELKRARDKRYRQNRDPERRREYVRAWEAANRERVRKGQRDSINRFLERYLLNRARSRAKADGMPFSITLEDISIPGTCPILGIPLVRGQAGRAAPGSPTLDRIICELGYVKGNVQVISHRANSMKRDGTLQELIQLGEWAARQLQRLGRAS